MYLKAVKETLKKLYGIVRQKYTSIRPASTDKGSYKNMETTSSLIK